MKLKTIVIGDRSVQVDEQRYEQFNVLAGDSRAMAITGLTGRDAQEAMAFLVSQLAYTEAQVFERQYTPMQYEQFLPITSEAGEWVDTIRYEIYDYAGRGKRTSGKGKDINLVDIAWADKTFPVVNGNIGYDYDQEELRRSAYLRRPLPERRLAAAIDGYRRHMNEVGLYGEGNLTGFFNNPNVPHGNAPNGAWLTTQATNISTTGVNNILADLNALIQGIWTTTQYNDQITDIVMAPQRLAYIASTPRSANSDKTILQWLLENNIAKVERGQNIKISAGYGLDTAGVGSTARMIGYVKSDTRLVMHTPMPLRFLAPQLIGLAVQIPGEYKYSGVEWRYPGSAYYMDGI
jgi:hypothetical protein